MNHKFPIGVFDSGIGGLTILKELVHKLPDYDFLYLGDNARAPYGNHDFDTVFQFTWECVKWLFEQGCPLVILACNTASAKALRNIQQKMLPKYFPDKRVLGVIRPTAEIIGNYSKSNHVGIFGTYGTIKSESYLLEIQKFFPKTQIFQQACPMWVPLVENQEHHAPGADYFVQKYIQQLLNQSSLIDTILLGCTHYPLMMDKIKAHLPSHIHLIAQGSIVANSLLEYLNRHPEIDQILEKQKNIRFYTTGDLQTFDSHIAQIMNSHISADIVKM